MTVLFLLLICAASTAAADFCLRRGGLEMLPMRWAFAVLFTWPIFTVLLRWRVAVEWRILEDLRLGEEFGRFDELVEGTPPAYKSQSYHSPHVDIQTGGSDDEGAGLLALIVLAALTLGIWLMWDLIQTGPKLIADLLIDAEGVRSRPGLALEIVTYRWIPETLGSTAIHFYGAAFAAFLLGSVFGISSE